LSESREFDESFRRGFWDFITTSPDEFVGEQTLGTFLEASRASVQKKVEF